MEVLWYVAFTLVALFVFRRPEDLFFSALGPVIALGQYLVQRWRNRKRNEEASQELLEDVDFLGIGVEVRLVRDQERREKQAERIGDLYNQTCKTPDLLDDASLRRPAARALRCGRAPCQLARRPGVGGIVRVPAVRDVAANHGELVR